MFKLFILVVLAIIAVTSAKPQFAYSAPLVAAPGYVTAQSSQVFARNYNGLAAYTAPVAGYVSPYNGAYVSPYAAAYTVY